VTRGGGAQCSEPPPSAGQEQSVLSCVLARQGRPHIHTHAQHTLLARHSASRTSEEELFLGVARVERFCGREARLAHLLQRVPRLLELLDRVARRLGLPCVHARRCPHTRARSQTQLSTNLRHVYVHTCNVHAHADACACARREFEPLHVQIPFISSSASCRMVESTSIEGRTRTPPEGAYTASSTLCRLRVPEAYTQHSVVSEKRVLNGVEGRPSTV
jgi:hypothetical protein